MSDKWDGRIVHEAADGLSREVWQFTLIPQMGRAVQLDLRLDYYETETRQTRRHGWRRNEYIAWRGWANTNPYSAIPFPADVQVEARNRPIDQIRLVLGD